MVSLLLLVACASAPRTFDRPNLVEVGADGQLFVSDFHHHRIVEFDADGQFVRAFGERGLGRNKIWQTWGMALDDDGGLLVSDQRPLGVGDRASVVEVKRFHEGREQRSAILTGVGGAHFSISEGMTTHPDGGLLVVDSASGHVLRYDDAWVFQETWGRVGRSDEAATTVTRSGEQVWVLEQYSHRFRQHDKVGRELQHFVRRGDEPGKVSFPRNLAVCPDNWLAVADLGNHRVQLFDLDGHHLDLIVPEPVDAHTPVQVMDVAVAPGCRSIWVADSKGNRVLELSPTGEQLRVIDGW